jgi:hypothetical protein
MTTHLVVSLFKYPSMVLFGRVGETLLGILLFGNISLRTGHLLNLRKKIIQLKFNVNRMSLQGQRDLGIVYFSTSGHVFAK